MTDPIENLRLWQRIIDVDGSKLKELPLPTIDLEKPTVLLFPGWLANHAKADNAIAAAKEAVDKAPNTKDKEAAQKILKEAQNKLPKMISGYLKIIENSLGGSDIHKSDNPIQLLSITHGEEASIKEVKDSANLRLSNQNPENHTTAPMDAFADALFAGIIRTPEGELQKIGKVQETLRNLTLISDSYGAVIAQKFYVSSKNFLSESGYRPEEVDDILATTLFLNVNGVSISIDPKIKSFPSIDFTNPEDITGGGQINIDNTIHEIPALMPQFKDLVHQTDGKHKVEKLSETKIRITADSVEDGIIKIHDGAKNRELDFRAKHDFQIYTQPRQGKESLVGLFQRSLCNAVKGSARSRNLEELLAPTITVGAPENHLSTLDLSRDITVTNFEDIKPSISKTSWVDKELSRHGDKKNYNPQKPSFEGSK